MYELITAVKKRGQEGDPQFDDVWMAEHAHAVDLALDSHLRVQSDDRSLRQKFRGNFQAGDRVEGNCSNKNALRF